MYPRIVVGEQLLEREGQVLNIGHQKISKSVNLYKEGDREEEVEIGR